MTALPDDDGEIACRDEALQLLVRFPNEWAGAVSNDEPGCAPRVSPFIGRPMRGDHDLGGIRLNPIERSFCYASLTQSLLDDRIMNQLAENSEAAFFGQALRVRDGIADTETETKMLS